MKLHVSERVEHNCIAFCLIVIVVDFKYASIYLITNPFLMINVSNSSNITGPRLRKPVYKFDILVVAHRSAIACVEICDTGDLLHTQLKCQHYEFVAI